MADDKRFCRAHQDVELKDVCAWCGDTVFENHAWQHAQYACLYAPDGVKAPAP